MKPKLDIEAAFFRENAHILRRGNADWPTHKILLQLAIEHADDSPLTQGAECWLAENRCDWFWLKKQKHPRWSFVDFHVVGSCCWFLRERESSLLGMAVSSTENF